MNYHEILPRLLVGSCPEGPADLEWLKQQEGVTAVLNLQTDADLAWLGLNPGSVEEWHHRCGLVLRREPVQDMDTQDLRRRLAECVQALDELLAAGHKVYLHCTAGVGRSPTVAIAWLIQRQGWSSEQAHQWVTRRRPCSPDMEAVGWALRQASGS